MQVQEFKQLFNLNDAELHEVAQLNNVELLHKKFREAAKLYHPDNVGGNSELFIKLQGTYKEIQVIGVTGLLGNTEVNRVYYFDIGETRKINDIIWVDLEGNRVDRRKTADSCMKVVATLNIQLYGDEKVISVYDANVYVDYRQDNKYCMELVVPVDKKIFESTTEHKIVLKMLPENDEEYIAEMVVNNSITKKNIRHNGIRLDAILKVRTVQGE